MTKEEAKDLLRELMCDDEYDEAIDMAIQALGAERESGEWIKNDDYVCDQCGYHMIVGGGAYNFCPNCGTDMRGKE